MTFNPHPEVTIEEGDTLIAVGPPENFPACRPCAARLRVRSMSLPLDLPSEAHGWSSV
jgi:hypothetical protein